MAIVETIDNLQEKCEKLESKLLRLSVLMYTFLFLGVAFGLTNFLGYNMLSEADDKLESSNRDINDNFQGKIEELAFAKLKVKQLDVVNNNDKTVASITEDTYGAGYLRLYNSEGKISTSIGGPHGGLALFNSEGKMVTSISGPHGGLALYNSEGVVGLRARATESAGFVRIFSTQERKKVANIGTNKDGAGDLELFNLQGKKVANIGTDKDGAGGLKLFNLQGTELVGIGKSTQGEGVLLLRNSRGKLGLSAHAINPQGIVRIWSTQTGGFIRNVP